MSDFITTLQTMQEEKERRERKAFWNGHSVFQAPYQVVGFKGTAPALVLLYLYERAGSVPFHCEQAGIIELKIKEETISSRTGLVRKSVSAAIGVLEEAGCIRVERSQSKVTGRMRVSVYLLLHPQTKQPLMARRKEFGICHSNGFELPYLTIPKESREILCQLVPVGRAVYIVTLALASKRMLTSFGVTRDELKIESRLGKNGFNRGLKQCKGKKLFTFKRGTLTLHDAATGEPSQRQNHPREWVKHENPNWRFDLDKVTSAQWERTITYLMKREFIVGADGWTRTQRGIICPFCKDERCFSVNFTTCQYICHENCGDYSKGRLGQLVKRVLRVSMDETKQFIQAHMDVPADKAA